MTRIAILLHHRKGNKLLIHHLANHWRSMGHDVVFYEGIGKRIEGDILIPQIDLTVTPKDYIEAIEAFDGIILNRGIYDISKKKISTQLVDESSGFEGEVIVKPNLNFNGYPELRLKSKVAKVAHLLKKSLGLVPEAYKVYSSIHTVPPKFKNSKKFVIEKFLPFKDQDEYVMGLTSFFGDRFNSVELRSKNPIIKGYNVSSAVEIQTPTEVVAAVKKHRYDYGKFDYCWHKGELVLFDTNKTPGSYGARVNSRIAEVLGPGIEYYTRRLSTGTIAN